MSDAAPSPWVPAAVAGLLLCGALQVGFSLLSTSCTYDEPAVIGAGAAYVKTGELVLEKRVYPPLMKYLIGAAALTARPGRLCDPDDIRNDRYYHCGFDFLYRNTVPPETLLTRARLPSLAVFLTLACFVFAWASRWYGAGGGLLALGACVFEPNLLAHAGLATVDMGLTGFFFVGAAFLTLYLEKGKPAHLLLAGLTGGAAMAVKTPGVLFYALAPAWAFLAGRAVKDPLPGTLRRAFRVTAGLVLLGGLVLLAVYQFRYTGQLVDLFRTSVGYGVGRPWTTFFHGNNYPGGTWYFFIAAFLIKTPLPFLILLGLALAFSPDRKKHLWLAVPALLFVGLFSALSKQNGLRYILPAYPFLCVMIGSLAAVKKTRWVRPATLALGGWLVIEAFSVAPYTLAYFNMLVGGPKNGHRWLVDCNLDWGQDLPAIRRAWEAAGRPELLSANITIAPQTHYFGPQQDVLVSNENPPEMYYRHLNSAAPVREWLVVSASVLEGWGLSKDYFAWLRDRKPLAQPGYSSFIYDVTRDPESQFNVGRVYQAMGAHPFALRQFRRAAALTPDDPVASVAEGDTLALMGRGAEARAAYRRARALARDAAVRAAIDRRLRDLPRVLAGGR